MSLENNPLLVTDGLPRYDEITPEQIVPGVKQVLETSEQWIAEL